MGFIELSVHISMYPFYFELKAIINYVMHFSLFNLIYIKFTELFNAL